MTKHVHAELMMQYAQDAMETDEPWERWEHNHKGVWYPLSYHPCWIKVVEYRRKPQTININGFGVPEPERKPLERGQSYYIPSLNTISCNIWVDSEFDRNALETGSVHLTLEAAEIHNKALLSFTAKGDE